MGLKNTILRGSRDPVNGQGHNINLACVAANRPTPSEQGNPHGRRPVTVKFDKVKEGLPTSGIQNTIFRGSMRRPSGRLKPEYSSGDQY